MTRQVVLITRSDDISGSVERIRTKLQDRGVAVMRFDTDRFPYEVQASFTADGGDERLVLRAEGKEFCLGPDDAIWYRRANWAGKLPQAMDRQLRHGCVTESEAFLRGVLAAAPCFVFDPPELVRKNGHKPYQLSLARRLGMATPRTLITNDPAEAHAFVRSCPNGAITKMLSGFPIYDDKGEDQVVFTTRVDAQHLDKLEGLRFSPMVFQEQVEKALELRITAVGGRLYAAAVDSKACEGAEIDWRARGVSLLREWKPYTLPAEVEQQLHRYMEAIGMQYSAIDIIVEPSGRHVFLEANPAGECYWLEFNSPYYAFTDALIDVMLGAPGARRVFPR